jgi:hypothetical protein
MTERYADLLAAISFAAAKHSTQRRKDVDASPYINHPLQLAHVLATEGGVIDVETLMAAVLHDNLRVWELNHRWASCSAAGNLNFNWRALGAPTDVLHYLVAHELAHLKRRNHTPEFWQAIDAEMPAWREAAEWLKQHGARMTL